jgi:hypothetical protein
MRPASPMTAPRSPPPTGSSASRSRRGSCRARDAGPADRTWLPGPEAASRRRSGWLPCSTIRQPRHDRHGRRRRWPCTGGRRRVEGERVPPTDGGPRAGARGARAWRMAWTAATAAGWPPSGSRPRSGARPGDPGGLRSTLRGWRAGVRFFGRRPREPSASAAGPPPPRSSSLAGRALLWERRPRRPRRRPDARRRCLLVVRWAPRRRGSPRVPRRRPRRPGRPAWVVRASGPRRPGPTPAARRRPGRGGPAGRPALRASGASPAAAPGRRRPRGRPAR